MERLLAPPTGLCQAATPSITCATLMTSTGIALASIWADTVRCRVRPSDKRYVVQTNPKVIARCIMMTTDPGDLVIDPTCGGGTTAIVAEQYGRRWITIDTSRVALAVARERLLTAVYDYYQLAQPERDVDGGFVYETQQRVTLGQIAKGEDPETVTMYRPARGGQEEDQGFGPLHGRGPVALLGEPIGPRSLSACHQWSHGDSRRSPPRRPESPGHPPSRRQSLCPSSLSPPWPRLNRCRLRASSSVTVKKPASLCRSDPSSAPSRCRRCLTLCGPQSGSTSSSSPGLQSPPTPRTSSGRRQDRRDQRCAPAGEP